jgi:hypothetical protein
MEFFFLINFIRGSNNKPYHYNVGCAWRACIMDFRRYINENTFRPLNTDHVSEVSSLYGEVKTYLIIRGPCGNETTG